MTPEVKSRVEEEVKRFATELNLSDAQKSQLKSSFEKAQDRMEDIRDSGAISKIRDSIREQVAKFLTPQQLTKWDAEMSKAKSFLGHSLKS